MSPDAVGHWRCTSGRLYRGNIAPARQGGDHHQPRTLGGEGRGEQRRRILDAMNRVAHRRGGGLPSSALTRGSPGSPQSSGATQEAFALALPARHRKCEPGVTEMPMSDDRLHVP